MKAPIGRFIVFLTILHPGSFFPYGAPTEACDSMTPGHGFPPSTTPCPYRLTAEVPCFEPGERVLLQLKDPDGKTFKGMLVEARSRKDSVPQSYGIFDVAGNTDLKLINCYGGQSNVITHAQANEKPGRQFGWTAPNDLTIDDIDFTYTVVQQFDTFWVKQILTLPRCHQTPIIPTKISTSSRDVTGKSKTQTKTITGPSRPTPTPRMESSRPIPTISPTPRLGPSRPLVTIPQTSTPRLEPSWQISPTPTPTPDLLNTNNCLVGTQRPRPAP